MIYYAHSVAIYDTPQEKRDIVLLEQLGFKVYNPNSEKDAEGYRTDGMQHFTRLLKTDAITGLAFRANSDGTINAGVAEEINAVDHEEKPVFELPSGILRRTLDVHATREILREQGAR